ncbi:ribonuclease R [[Mycoplasma] falconis]|uniref:Ribonuclease R n=1 Tax=[Mycoplasma] falconis TaxID=92403 RepID=A0A501XAP6_9BACT|nr:ribonuclease R [[Mycoplasma] falconis]TPE57437.1 ribonuclease R [[Mycoplasma] falconis]
MDSNLKNKFKTPKFKVNQQQLLEFIQNNEPVAFLDLAKKLKVPSIFNKELTVLLNELIKDNKIEINRDNKYIAIYFVKEIETNIAITNKRLGFIDFEDQGEPKSAFVAPFQIKNCLSNDLVLADIFYYYNDKKEILYKANIKKVLQHSRNIIVGTIKKANNKVYFTPMDEKDKGNFEFIADAKSLEKLTEKDVISCVILKPNNKNIAIGFKKIIGNVEDKEFVIKKIIATNEVNTSFNQEVLKEVKNISQEVTPREIKERKDLRDLMTVTIDGLDTKDFDDAISCYQLENGNWKLFIHIADVSYYVKEDSEIDKEALKRGTSIYLPDKVIPMLPFELSNGICSLNPNVDRACLTLELEIDKDGNNVSSDIYASVINSNYRLTYNEVNDYFNNKNNVPQEVSKILDASRDLSKIIRQKKLEEGYVDFEIKEPKIIMDGDQVIDIKIREEGESEKLIEDFMVRANETVAEMMTQKEIPSIYRIHDKPENEKLLNLQDLINFSGYKNINVPFDGQPKSFGEMIAKIKNNGFDDYMKMAMLRTMQKAVYSSDNIGHFGLASKAYSHFTSPIRRYPDLLLHRLIRKYIFEKQKIDEDNKEEIKHKIEEIAIKNSESEKTAVTVERDIVDVRKSEFFEKFIGKTFNATLVSVEKFGVFFNIEEFQTSVLIRYDDIEDNMQKVSNFEAKGMTKTLKVGKKYLIIITSVEKEKGNINAKLA